MSEVHSNPNVEAKPSHNLLSDQYNWIEDVLLVGIQETHFVCSWILNRINPPKIYPSDCPSDFVGQP